MNIQDLTEMVKIAADGRPYKVVEEKDGYLCIYSRAIDINKIVGVVGTQIQADAKIRIDILPDDEIYPLKFDFMAALKAL